MVAGEQVDNESETGKQNRKIFFFRQSGVFGNSLIGIKFSAVSFFFYDLGLSLSNISSVGNTSIVGKSNQ